MRVFIHNYTRDRFLGDDTWVSDPRHALSFHSFAEATDYALEHGVQSRSVLSYITQEEYKKEKQHRAEERRTGQRVAVTPFSHLARTGWYP